MGQDKVTTTHVVSGLEVAGLNEEDFWELSDAYTQETMPVHSGNIPKQKDLQGWPYLKHVNLPDIDSDIELLIGINAPRVMEAIQVIHSVDNGPYAIKTRLGWTVNGPLRGDWGNQSSKYPDVTINRICVSNLGELWQQQFEVDFPECSKNEQVGFSREDHKFIEMVTEQTRDARYTGTGKVPVFIIFQTVRYHNFAQFGIRCSCKMHL